MIHLFQLCLQNWLNMRIQSGAKTIKEMIQHYAKTSSTGHKKHRNEKTNKKLEADMQPI